MKNRPYPFYEGYPEYENVRALLLHNAKRYDTRIAYSYREKPGDTEKCEVTFRDFAAEVRALGTAFIARGVEGKRVGLIGRLSFPWVLCYFSLLSVGAVLVPLDPEWTEADLAETAAKAKISFLLCDAEIAEKAQAVSKRCGNIPLYFTRGEEKNTVAALLAKGKKLVAKGDDSFLRAPVQPSALSLLVFTSGTTGKGKGVMLSQKNILSDVAAGLCVVKIGKKMIGVLPPHHTFGSTIGILGIFCLGSEVYLSSGLRYFAREMKQEKPDSLVLVPLFLETFASKILSSAAEQGKADALRRAMTISGGLQKLGIHMEKSLFTSVLDSFGGKLETVVTGGAPLNKETARLFRALGIRVLDGYGITECSPLISVNRNERVVEGTVGLPIPCLTVKIDAPDEKGEGEICVKGDNVMLGYYEDEAATAAVTDKDGYFHTGDIGKFHKSGYLMITGRLKNLIILANGKNVYPEEIEGALAALPGVLDAVVYMGKSRRGAAHDRIVAEIYPDAGFLKREGVEDARLYYLPLIEKYNKEAVPYKKIGFLRIRTEPFPKNTLQKITRFRLDKTID